MSEATESYIVTVPEQFIGEVCGELIEERSGLVVKMEDSESVYKIHAQMPEGSMEGLGKWLGEITSRQGKLARSDD